MPISHVIYLRVGTLVGPLLKLIHVGLYEKPTTFNLYMYIYQLSKIN